MIRYCYRCAAEVLKLNRTEASARKGQRQRQHPPSVETVAVSSELSPLVASKAARTSERFSKSALNRLIMTACDSSFRLPYCHDFTEIRQNLGEDGFLSC